MIFVGVDWAEAHNDVVVMDDTGVVLGRARVGVGVAGLAQLHELVGAHVSEPTQVAVGLELDRGLLVDSLAGAGYAVYGINPLAASRYRERHSLSRAKSDTTDAKLLADLVRTDRHNHRQIAADTDQATAIRALARTHQSLIWARASHTNALRADLREYYPGAREAFADLTHPDALAILAIAPTPAQGRALTHARIRAALARAGRQRYLDRRATQIQQALRAPQPHAAARLTGALGTTTRAQVRLLVALNDQIADLQAAITEHFDEHPDAEILGGLPGLGPVLGARVLGEFGDDPNRFTDAKGRKAYAGTAPITRASGLSRIVLARFIGNRRLVDACMRWAFCSLSASPGARRYYDQLRARGKTHHQALRQLANRWVGILHTCLERRTTYQEHIAWHTPQPHHLTAAAA